MSSVYTKSSYSRDDDSKSIKRGHGGRVSNEKVAFSSPDSLFKVKKLKTKHERTVSEVCRLLHKEWWICAVCMELMYRPHTCKPCNHTFCQPCLQALAARHPQTTDCPMCRSIITDCQLSMEVDSQINKQFPVEYAKAKEMYPSDGPLPGRSARQSLTVGQWLRHTLGNRANRGAERTDRVMWHFISFAIMLTVVISGLYLGHFIILASRYMSDYIPEVPVPDEIKLANVPLIVIGFIGVLILLLR